MSSILKALQKLEHDKDTRKTREPDISTAIKMSGARKKGESRWLIPVVVLSVALVSILATFSFMGGFSGKKEAAPPSVQQQISPQQSPTANQPPERPTATVQAVEPQVQQQVIPKPPVATRPRPATVQTLPASQLSNLPSAPIEAAPQPSQPEAVAQQPAPPAEKPSSRPRLNISGIAWQQDSASRIAVVNGSSVSEGGSVDGVRVEQIFPDRVRFSQGGKMFDVSLDQEGRH